MYGVGQSSPQRRGWLIVIGVIVLILVVIGLFFAFYKLVLENGEEPAAVEATATTVPVAEVPTDTVALPTDTATSEPASPATPTTLPTLPPTDTPLPTPTLRPPPEAITVGVRARVNLSEGLRLNLRDLPALSGSTVITQLVGGAVVDVIEGPEEESDLTWWKVQGSAQPSGWVVEALDSDVLLQPVDWTAQLPPLAPITPTATAAPTAAPVLTPTATATPAITATATPITPTVTPEGGIPSPTVGGRAQVTTQYQYVNLRADPGLGAETVGQLENGTVVTILEGPEEADDLRWWRVEDEGGNTGWAAERVGTEVLLVPIP